jgi:hypothetical protein
MRNAVAAAPLTERETSKFELNASGLLIDALFDVVCLRSFFPAFVSEIEPFVAETKNLLDEVEPMVQRYQELAVADSRTKGRLSSLELKNIYNIARLHEVMCILHPVLETPSHCSALAFYRVDSLCHGVRRA